MRCLVRCERCPGATPADFDIGEPQRCDIPSQDCERLTGKDQHDEFEVTHEDLLVECEPLVPGDGTDVPALAQRLLRLNSALSGIGFAAPQAGIRKQIAVVTVAKPLVLVNPCITKHGRDIITAPEGCLSVYGTVVNVPRYRIVTVEWLDQFFAPHRAVFTNLEARAIQHELDHLRGVLITSYQTEQSAVV